MEDTHTAPRGTVLGAILLIAGCCIGGGMLGLPVLSAVTGFGPSVVMFLLSWAYMTCTGLLLLEVALWFKGESNVVSMASRAFGFIGKAVAWLTFLFLFYCLNVAYVAGSGDLVSDLVERIFRVSIPQWVGSVGFTLILAVFLYLGTRAVDQFNRILMVGLIASYFILVALGLPHVDPTLLTHYDWAFAPYVLPVMIISFGYHNLVPSLVTYLHHDVKQLRRAIIIGSTIPLIVYLVWQALILGLAPLEGPGGFREALEHGHMATHVLRLMSGTPWVVSVAQAFAFFAIVTSFVAVALSFVDFLADGLKIKKTAFGKLILCVLVLLPPLVLAFIYPELFLTALNYAGGLGAVILFGILPALMVWSGRYRQKFDTLHLVPGGRVVLTLVILFSLGIIAMQVKQMINALNI